MPDTDLYPGQEARTKAVNAIGRTGFIFLCLAVVGICSIITLPSAYYEWVCVVMVVSLFILFGSSTTVWWHYAGAMNTLQDSWSDQRSELVTLKGRHQELSDFAKDFRPPQEYINEVLIKAAKKMKAAFEEEFALYEKGAGHSISYSPENHDIEDKLKASTEHFRNEEEMIRRHVKEAKDDFWRLWKLAKEKDYLVYSTWKPYAEDSWRPPTKMNIGVPVGQKEREDSNVISPHQGFL